MNHLRSTACHRALIPEVLVEVFRNVPHPVLLDAALVCYSWSELALDVKWRDLDGLYHLFKLLGPMVYDNKSRWSFSQGLSTPNWPRFFRYCDRVRSLNWDSRYDVSKDTIFLVLLSSSALHLRAGGLLPRLQRLNWVSRRSVDGIEAVMAFMPPTLRRFTIQALPRSTEEVDSVDRTFQCISGRSCLRLTHLTLDVRAQQQWWWCPASLAECIAQSSGLRYLHGVSCNLNLNLAGGDCPILGAICTLRDLQSLHFSLSSGPDDVIRAFQRIAEGCPALVDIAADVQLDDGTGTGTKRMQLDWATSALYAHSALESLKLTCGGGVDFDSADIARMGAAWRNIKTLQITGDDSVPTDSDPSVSLLPVFATHFAPSLTSLSLQLNLTKLGPIPIPPPQPFPFPSLSCLRLHISDTRLFLKPHALRLAELVGRVTLDGCALDVGLPCRAAEWADEDSGVWEMVEDVVRRARSGVRATRRRMTRSGSTSAYYKTAPYVVSRGSTA